MQARYYDPVIGRFYSNDPVSASNFISDGKVQGFGRYTYAFNNPYRYNDPNGRAPGDPFTSPSAAAKDFGVNYNDDSIRHNVEFFAAIYSEVNSTGNKSFSYNIPNKGQGATVTMDTKVQPGQTLESTVHSHAAYDPKYANNTVSQGDINTMVGSNNEFVTTPNGSLIEYSTNGNTQTLATDLPSDSQDPSRLNKVAIGKKDDVHR